MLSSRVLLSLTLVALIGAENVAEQQQNDQIPAWYQMSKPATGGSQRVASAGGVPVAQASPSYYERIEAPTYETRREQPGYERPGIQTNQYANYPTYQNRQPYENLNALTAGASLSNLQQAAGRRYPSSVPIQAAGNDNQSAVKRYHKLLLKRRQWTTKIPRVLAKSTTSPETTTTSEPITTQKMPKSLKSIYSTIVPKKKEEGSTTTRKVVRASTRAPMARTFKPYGTRKGWRMWKKATTAQPSTTQESTTTEVPTTTPEELSTTTEEVTTQEILTTEEPTTSTTEEYTTLATSSTTEEATTTEEITSTTEKEVIATTEDLIETSTEISTTTTSTNKEDGSTTSTTTTHGPLRYICRHRAGPNESGPFAERHLQTTQGPFRPIVVGTHSWKPLRFKKPQNVTDLSTAPKGLKLLEYLLTRTDAFARGLKRAFKGPNTELLAAIKDVVAKFKASLDEAGIDQDVRQMGNQLKNTWQQLRTGPMNEQLGKLFEKAVADAAESKQQTRNNQ